ncbi:MAG: response regulator [Lachnospiraceae bacterium]|nr:response regulator [Lachnospiraceae bacterium]
MSNIILVTTGFSIVVKGLEKELKKLSHNVKTVDKGFTAVSEEDYLSDVLLLYLPDNLPEDPQKVKELSALCDNVKDHNCELIMIGANKIYDLILEAVPEVKDHIWLNRPLNMNRLSEEIEKATQKTPDYTAKKKILIVDDDPVYGMMIRNWLKEVYTVSTLTEGMQTVDFLTDNQVDLVLLDYEMPVADGPQVLNLLRANPKTKNVHVMFLTGVSDDESIKRVSGLETEGYILKSDTKGEILNKIADYFAKTR